MSEGQPEQGRIVRVKLGRNFRLVENPKYSERLGEIIGLESKRGTGKTRAVLSMFAKWAYQYPGSPWLIARSTKVRLANSVMQTLDEQILPLMGLPVPKDSREHRKVYVFPGSGGSRFIFQGLQDEEMTQSAEYAGAYVAEAVELDTESQMTALVGALRWHPRHGEPLKRRLLIADFNPGPPGHWCNQRFEPVVDDYRRIQTRAEYMEGLFRNARPPKEGYFKRIISTWMDNPYYWDWDEWDWTEEGRRYIKGLEYLSGHLRTRWLYGLWAAAEGVVYAQFDSSLHVCEPFTVPADWPWWLGFDAGYDHPMALLWFTRSPAGRVYVAQEMYGSGYEIRDVCQHIHNNRKGRNILRIFGDPQMCFSKTQHSTRTIAQQFREFNLSLAPWPPTGRNAAAMVESVRTMLTHKDDDDQPRPLIMVFRTCENTIMEFQSWRYKRTSAGAIPSGDDQFEDVNNHAMDTIRGVTAAGIGRIARGVTLLDGKGNPVTKPNN